MDQQYGVEVGEVAGKIWFHPVILSKFLLELMNKPVPE